VAQTVPLRQRMIEDMTVRNFDDRLKSAYRFLALPGEHSNSVATFAVRVYDYFCLVLHSPDLGQMKQSV
jgi:hypothetical protein